MAKSKKSTSAKKSKTTTKKSPRTQKRGGARSGWQHTQATKDKIRATMRAKYGKETGKKTRTRAKAKKEDECGCCE